MVPNKILVQRKYTSIYCRIVIYTNLAQLTEGITRSSLLSLSHLRARSSKLIISCKIFSLRSGGTLNQWTFPEVLCLNLPYNRTEPNGQTNFPLFDVKGTILKHYQNPVADPGGVQQVHHGFLYLDEQLLNMTCLWWKFTIICFWCFFRWKLSKDVYSVLLAW